MKAQTQALTTVLITTVIVGAAASTYVWGQPLLEKQQSKTEVQKVERTVTTVYSMANAVAQSGSGHRSQVEVSLTEGTLRVNDTGNYIEITAPFKNAPYASQWTLLRGETKKNTSVLGGNFASEGSPMGILAVKSTSSGSQDTVRYRIEFRNVRNGNRLRRIELEPVGRKTGSGEFTVSLTNRGERVDSNYRISTGESFELVKTVVEVDIQ